MTQTGRWMSVKEASKFLGLHKNTILRMIHRGRLKAMRTSDAPNGKFIVWIETAGAVTPCQKIQERR